MVTLLIAIGLFLSSLGLTGLTVWLLFQWEKGERVRRAVFHSKRENNCCTGIDSTLA